MLYGGRPVAVPACRLVVHWGMLPHQILKCDPAVQVLGVHLPLVWCLQWEISTVLTARLLGMELLIEPLRTRPCSDLALLKDWKQLLQSNRPEANAIVLAEVRARLLRVSLTQHASHPFESAPAPASAAGGFHRALELIATQFREPLRLSEVAGRAGISPRHLTRLFHEHTGQTINAYITRLRLLHVQRLLMTTRRKVLDIMYESGFSCPTHFYRVFQERERCTPRQYRQWARQGFGGPSV